MAKLKRQAWTAADYERAAAAYYHRLPLEHFMEAIPAAKQREITIESFALLRHCAPDVQCFNELLVQYWFQGRVRQVVPDNMARRCDRPPVTETSLNLDLEPVGPLMVMEYVSPASYREDYKDNFRKYESELLVPYYLLLYPERQDLHVYHLREESYQPLAPNARGRLEVPELELEVALLDRCVRYWFRGELLLLPAELQHNAEQAEQRLHAAEAELARLRTQLAQPAGSTKPPRNRKKNGS